MWNSSRKAGFSLIAAMAIGAIIVGANPERQRRVVGQDVGPNEASFVVLISSISTGSGSEVPVPLVFDECTGAIIGPRHVLTTGRCIDGNEKGMVGVDPGIFASRIVVHPKYGSTDEPGYDLGILEFAEDVDLTSGGQTIISLAEEERDFDRSGIQYSFDNCGGDSFSTKIQKVDVSILKGEYCNYEESGHYPHLLCVQPTKTLKICREDSGAPLVSDGRLAGVLSSGQGWEKEAALYAAQNVYHNLDWIKSVLNGQI